MCKQLSVLISNALTDHCDEPLTEYIVICKRPSGEGVALEVKSRRLAALICIAGQKYRGNYTIRLEPGFNSYKELQAISTIASASSAHSADQHVHLTTYGYPQKNVCFVVTTSSGSITIYLVAPSEDVITTKRTLRLSYRKCRVLLRTPGSDYSGSGL